LLFALFQFILYWCHAYKLMPNDGCFGFQQHLHILGNFSWAMLGFPE